jgi:hypothetical protein
LEVISARTALHITAVRVFSRTREGTTMGKNQNTFEKRRREVEKRQKAEEKRKRRQQKKDEPASEPNPVVLRDGELVIDEPRH